MSTISHRNYEADYHYDAERGKYICRARRTRDNARMDIETRYAGDVWSWIDAVHAWGAE